MSEFEIISRKEAISRGLTHYFTGKPCPHGHVARRFVSSYNCVECGRITGSKKNKGKKRHYVSDDYVIGVIDSCSSYSEFTKTKEYSIASKRGLIDLAIARLGHGKTSKRWDADACAKEALKYSSRKDFLVNASGAYDAAINFGILNECCAHMYRNNGDYDVVYIWGSCVGDNAVCKVGVTSERLGLSRIIYVSRSAHLKLNFLLMLNDIDATSIEGNLLTLGSKYDIDCSSGWTEFRTFSKSEIEGIFRSYKWNSVAVSGIQQGVAA